MKKRTRVMVTFGFIVLMITGMYIFTDWFSRITGYFIGEDEKTRLAQCLDGKHAEFYGTEYCAECERQRDIFGRSFNTIVEIDCGRNMENCPNIREIPAWHINKSIHYGFKNFTQLKDLSGCID
jgi:hypothetical protein